MGYFYAGRRRNKIHRYHALASTDISTIISDFDGVNEQGFTLWDVQDAFLTLTQYVRQRTSEQGRLERRRAREDFREDEDKSEVN